MRSGTKVYYQIGNQVHEGTVISKVGPHAVKVLTQKISNSQNFLTGKVTSVEYMGESTWPIKKLMMEKPE